jgi:hypothetical protein
MHSRVGAAAAEATGKETAMTTIESTELAQVHGGAIATPRNTQLTTAIQSITDSLRTTSLQNQQSQSSSMMAMVMMMAMRR